MSCSNCYNGCTEIVSDRCVKYTGIDIPILEIKNGDSLSYVEQALIQFLVSTLDGSGIKITLPESAYCDLVKKYLPTCGDITVVTLFEALVKAACDLQVQINTINSTLDALNADYTIGCLTGVTASSDTHAIVQAIITKLCEIEADLSAFEIDVETNYVKLADLNSLIASYISTTALGNKYYSKMVPYTVVEYYGNLTGYPTMSDGFSSSGVGYGYWEKIYLCNGLNGTPDKRGRVPVGVTNGMGGGAFSPTVDPAIPGNPTYTIGSVSGTNTVTLSTAQIPSHTHTPTITLNDPGHTHSITQQLYSRPINYGNENSTPVLQSGPGANSTLITPVPSSTIASATTGITVSSATNSFTGSGLSHQNNQPALACYYIMYIP